MKAKKLIVFLVLISISVPVFAKHRDCERWEMFTELQKAQYIYDVFSAVSYSGIFFAEGMPGNLVSKKIAELMYVKTIDFMKKSFTYDFIDEIIKKIDMELETLPEEDSKTLASIIIAQVIIAAQGSK